MKNFFADCKTLDELKAAYRAAVKKYHPDRGGDTETMKKINNDHDARFEELKKVHNSTHDAEHQTTESPEEFRNIIEALLRLDGIEVELCGRWLWIGGETKQHKEALKAAGCRWSNNKKMWYWHHAEDGSRYHKGRKTIDQIRSTYGSQSFTAGRESNYTAIGETA